MKNKSVYIITDLYPPAFSPRIISIVRTLSNNGFDVVVFTEEQRTHLLFKSYSDICLTYRINVLGESKIKRNINRILELIFQYKEKSFFINIKKLLKENNINKPDIVLCFCYRKFPIKASHKISDYFGVPIITDCRDLIEQNKKFVNVSNFNFIDRLIEKILIKQRNKYLQKSTYITTVSKWHKEKLLSYFPNKNIEIIYNGYDDKLFKPSSLPNKQDNFNIIFTGRLIDKQFRDPTLILQAVKELENICQHINLNFYTDKNSADIINSINKNINCKVNIYDFVDHKQVHLLLDSSSLIILISNSLKHGGGQGMITTKIFEAIAMDKPIILFSDIESEACDILKNSKKGIASDDKEEIKQFIKTNYSQWEKYGFCRVSGDKDFADKFIRDNQNTKMIEIINTTINDAK